MKDAYRVAPRDAIASVSETCSPAVENPSCELHRSEHTLADAIRVVLESGSEPLTAAEIRDRLRESKFEIERYPDAMSSVRAILKDLMDNRAVEAIDIEGRMTYRLSHRSSSSILMNSLPLRDERVPLNAEPIDEIGGIIICWGDTEERGIKTRKR
jgi:hypothetical protein